MAGGRSRPLERRRDARPREKVVDGMRPGFTGVNAPWGRRWLASLLVGLSLGLPGTSLLRPGAAYAATTITLTPTSGAVGRQVTVANTGGSKFASNATVTVRWDSTSSTTGTVIATCTANGGGNLTSSCTFQVPAGAATGAHNVFVYDSTTSGTATFTVTGSATRLAITSVNGGSSPAAGSPGFPVTVQAQDANGNATTVTANTSVTLSLKTGTGTLGGTTTGTITAGASSVTISGVTYTKAESGVVLTAGANGLTSGDSAAFTVLPGPATKLQILVPGETAAPGTTSGKTGTPSTQTAGTAFTVTVNAVDANWNRVTTANPTVHLTSTDTAATLPANAALSSGTTTFSVALNTASSGGWTITVSDTASSGALSPNTSAAIPVNPAATAPGAPTVAATGSAAPGNARATVTWSPPASAGTGTITSYTITAYLGASGAVPQGTATSTTACSTTCSGDITGLTNGTTYSFTVKATNSSNLTGPESGHSNTVVPTATGCGATGLGVCGGAPGSFSGTLTGLNQNLYATLGAYSVQDYTPGGGWRLTVAATLVTCVYNASTNPKCPTGGAGFAAGSLAMAAPGAACQGTGTLNQAMTAGQAIDNGAVTIASYSGGDGSCAFTPGDFGTGTGSLRVTVPGDAYAANYSSTITFTISTGP